MKKSIFLFGFVLVALAATAAGREGREDRPKGQLTGSFESSSIFYVEDLKSGAIAPEDNFSSNNYLKADYYQGRFSAGIQAEGYMPVLQGYPTELKGVALTNYYMQWTDDSFSITAGTYYRNRPFPRAPFPLPYPKQFCCAVS